MCACNAVYEVREGRSFWKRRPLQVAVTLVLVVLITGVAIAIASNLALLKLSARNYLRRVRFLADGDVFARG